MMFGIAIAEHVAGDAKKLNRVLFAALEDANYDRAYMRKVTSDSLLFLQSPHTPINMLPVGSARGALDRSEANGLSFYIAQDHLEAWNNPDEQDSLDTLGMMVAHFAGHDGRIIKSVMADAYRYSQHRGHADAVEALLDSIHEEMARDLEHISQMRS